MATPSRWRHLEAFVREVYDEPPAWPEQPAEGVGPLAAREWFAITASRRFRPDGFTYPRRRDFGRWPKHSSPVVVFRPFIEEAWTIAGDADDEDPVVQAASGTEPFAGTLSQLLTSAVIVETLFGSRVLGRQAATKFLQDHRGLPRAGPGERTLAALSGPRFAPYLAGWPILRGWRVMRREDGQVWTLEGNTGVAMVRSRQAWAELMGRVEEDRQAAHEAEERAETEKRAAKRAELERERGPTTGPELLAALEAIEERLLRYQKAFLADLRCQVRAGTASDGLLLQAKKLLAERG